jgi:hypothetical protein
LIRRLLFVPVLVLALATPAGASPAHVISPYTYADGVGDVADGRGDVVSVRMDFTTQRIVWRLRFRQDVHLDQATWRTGSASFLRIAFPEWNLDGEPRVEVRPGPNGARVSMRLPDSSGVCPTQMDQPDGLRSLRIRMSIPCRAVSRSGEPEIYLRTRVGLRFDRGGDGTVDQVDSAPGRGYTPWIQPH